MFFLTGLNFNFLFGAPGGIRTPDPRIRSRIKAFFTKFYQTLQFPKMPIISGFFLSSTFYLVLPKSTFHGKVWTPIWTPEKRLNK